VVGWLTRGGGEREREGNGGNGEERGKRERGMGGMGCSVRDSFGIKMLPETLLYTASLNINKGERSKTYSSICVFTEINPTQPLAHLFLKKAVSGNTVIIPHTLYLFVKVMNSTRANPLSRNNRIYIPSQPPSPFPCPAQPRYVQCILDS